MWCRRQWFPCSPGVQSLSSCIILTFHSSTNVLPSISQIWLWRFHNHVTSRLAELYYKPTSIRDKLDQQANIPSRLGEEKYSLRSKNPTKSVILPVVEPDFVGSHNLWPAYEKCNLCYSKGESREQVLGNIIVSTYWASGWHSGPPSLRMQDLMTSILEGRHGTICDVMCCIVFICS